ncbi:MAG: hypothetical protein J0H12_05845 [Candidatus Paracaedimonas acanthamoebae]|uniref:PD-(D/E)XK endonuclease-like domain-containing protein n=1 Tax=Candidatus Paracaedimonas acanthamoebae TaxID=244581 RepID=A0A8J7PRM4_9PROT|nr:hypothetical protein [Candidatus Paracaedimonas acanthamoebae]
MKILKFFSLLLILTNLSDIAISSASSSSSESTRDIRREISLGERIDTTADAFNADPNSSTLVNFLKAVANYANFLEGADRLGSTVGVDKHAVCKDAIQRVQHLRGGALLHVDPAKIITTSGGERAQLDVVWVSGKDVYVYDFKFGGAKSDTFQRKKYERALTERYPGRTIHKLIEIHPRN